MSSGSDAVPVTRTGARVGHVAEQRAEGDDHLAAGLLRATDTTAWQNDFQRTFGSTPRSTTRSRSSNVTAKQSFAGHVIDARHAVDQLDLGTVRLVVEVLVGIDARDTERIVLADEPVGGPGGGVAGVVPARERGDEQGSTEVRTLFPHQAVGHRVSLRPRSVPVYSAAMGLSTADEYRASLR